MKDKRKMYTEEDIAKGEPPIAANDLLEEIIPLLQDYFIGEILLTDNGVTYSLPNGQKFILTAQAA